MPWRHRVSLYNWCILLRLTSGFVNPRKWCSPRRSRGEHHFRGLTNADVNIKRMHHLFFIWLFYDFFIFCLKCSSWKKKSAGVTEGIFTHFKNWFYREQTALSRLKFTNEIFQELHIRRSNCRKRTGDCSYKRRRIKIQTKQLRKLITKVLS